MAEYRLALGRAKFGFDRSTVCYLLAAIEKYGLLVAPSPSGAVLTDSKDLPFYEALLALEDGPAWLVTGNLWHFPKRASIVTPRQLLDNMR